MNTVPNSNSETSLIRRILNWLIVGVIAVTLLYFAFRGVDFAELLETARQGDWRWLLIGSLFLSLTLILRSLRWRVLLEAERPINPTVTFGATIIGYLGNAFLPARLGEVLRSVSINRATGMPTIFALTTALTERILDAAFLVIVSLILLAQLETFPEWLVTATQVMGGLGFIALVILILLPRFETFFQKIIDALPLPDFIESILSNLLDKLIAGMRVLQNPRRLLGFAIYTIIVWSVDVIVALCVAAAFDLNLSIVAIILLLAALGLGSAVPSTPGYVGVYQFVTVTVLAPFGVMQTEALVYILVYQGITYFTLLFWGLPAVWFTRSTHSDAEPLEAKDTV